MMMLVCLLVLSIVRDTLQHGYMIDPPSRSSLWRVNKKAPPNYNDNRLYCGGRSVSNLYLKTWNFFFFFHILSIANEKLECISFLRPYQIRTWKVVSVKPGPLFFKWFFLFLFSRSYISTNIERFKVTKLLLKYQNNQD